MMNLAVFNYLILCSNSLATEPSFWQKLAENATSGFLTLLGIGIAAYLAYRYALMQKRKETFIGLEKIKYEKKLLALEGCWKLLAFMTDTENAKTILTWHQLKNSKTYYFNKKNAEDFIQQIALTFYETGAGIYLSKEIKETLFHYRNIIYGFLLKEANNETATIEIQKPETAKKMISLHQELVLQLKQEVAIIDKIEHGT